MKRPIFVALALLSMSACAPTPDSVQATEVSGAVYQKLECSDLVTERQRVSDELIAMTEKQAATAHSDAIGFWLIGMPVGSMGGGNVAVQLGELKGRMNTVKRVMAEKGCQ